jgi:hypothetical protein
MCFLNFNGEQIGGQTCLQLMYLAYLHNKQEQVFLHFLPNYNTSNFIKNYITLKITEILQFFNKAFVFLIILAKKIIN